MTIATAVIAVVVALLYLPALGFELVFDDPSLIGPDGPRPLGPEGLPYRPLRYLSLRLDYWIGGGRIWVYHATNLLLHAAVCSLTFGIARTLGASGFLALLAGVTVASHPLCVESVAYVAGRRDLLACLFGLCAIRAWIAGSGRTAAAVLLVLAGVAAKESALIFITVLALASRFGFGPPLRSAVPMLVAVSGAGLALPVAYGAIGPALAPAREVALIAGRTTAHYAAGLLWPATLSVEYPELICQPGCPQMFSNATFVGFTIMLAMLVGSVHFLRRPLLASGHDSIGFAFCWMTAVAFSLALVVGLHEPGADRHAYPLLVAVSVLFALLVTRACGTADEGSWSACRARQHALGMLIAAIWSASIPAFGLVTEARLHAWANESSLWRATLDTTPDSARARFNTAAIRVEQGRYFAARRHLRRLLQSHPGDGRAYAALAWIDCADGRMIRARSHIEKAHQFDAPFGLIENAERECSVSEDVR